MLVFFWQLRTTVSAHRKNLIFLDVLTFNGFLT